MTSRTFALVFGLYRFRCLPAARLDAHSPRSGRRVDPDIQASSPPTRAGVAFRASEHLPARESPPMFAASAQRSVSRDDAGERSRPRSAAGR